MSQKHPNRGEFFKGVMQWRYPDPETGQDFPLPVFYQDNLSMTAIYTASAARVRALLPFAEMRPVELTPGRALVAVTCFEYRQCDIDPYNEVSVSFLITWGERALPGVTVLQMMARRTFTAFIWQLPVTTEIARRGGVDLFGYPKFIADIVFTREAGRVTCELSEGGERILTLRGKALRTKPDKVNRYRTYSVKDGVPLVANVYMNPLAFGQSMLPGAAELSVGKRHPIGRQLEELGLGRRPVLYQYAPEMEAILYGPRNLADH